MWIKAINGHKYEKKIRELLVMLEMLESSRK
jgi:hypothetical protein